MSPSTARSEFENRSVPIPRGEKRRREIAAVAERAFFVNDFENSTMQAFAAEAETTKDTLYRNVGSKEELFSEIIENRSERFLQSLDEGFRPGALAETLYEFAFHIFEAMTQSDGLCLWRIVVAEGPRNPDLGVIFFEKGPERVMKRLAQFLRASHDHGELRCPDTERAAKILLGATLTYHHMTALVLPNQPDVSKAEIRAHVSEAVSLFLLRYKA